MTINVKTPNTEITIEQVLEKTNTFNYLGMTINNKGTMDDHIKKIKGKTEAALQMIFTLAGIEEFHNIEMSTLWKLLDTCIIPNNNALQHYRKYLIT